MTVTGVPRQDTGPGQGASQLMTSIEAENRKSLMLFTGRAFPELAEEIGGVLGVRPTPMDAYDFANGEIFVRYRDSVRGSDAFVVQSMAHPVNKWMVESLIMVDALKRGSAKRITVVVPFYPYSRQDKKHRGREPISARLMADLYKTAGADRILTVDLHTAQVQGFFDGPVDHLFAMNLLAEYVESKWVNRPITVVAPDSGRVRVAERWTDRLGGCPLAFIHKTRDPLKPNQIVANRVVGDVEGRVGLIVDDMIDTGGTIARAAEILFDEGAADVIVAATHPILSDPATERLRNSKVSEVVVTNTLPIPPEKLLDKITVLSIAPLLARAIREVFDDGSVTTLFGGLS
jgi:ribose-phosphate pyrophosphokinase